MNFDNKKIKAYNLPINDVNLKIQIAGQRF